MYLHIVHAFAGGKNLAHLKARTLKNRDRIVEFFFFSVSELLNLRFGFTSTSNTNFSYGLTYQMLHRIKEFVKAALTHRSSIQIAKNCHRHRQGHENCHFHSHLKLHAHKINM